MPSDIPPGTVPPDSGQHWGPHPSASSYPSVQAPPVPSLAFGRPARWATFTALAIALIALAVGVVGWFRPAQHVNPPPPTYTAQQSADAKAKVCAAFDKVQRAVGVANAVPHGSDATGQLAAATSMRQVFDAGSRYLLMTLGEAPATPPDLATAVHQEASSLQEGVMGYLDGLTNSDPEMQPLVDANTEAANTIQRLCK